jgi:GT2 family glycosyltransferase
LQNMDSYKFILSIVIVNLNTADLTIECLKSIKKTADNLTFEVLLIDNGSDDDSVKKLQHLLKEEYWEKKIKLILNPVNNGYASANNQGIKKAEGKYILLLNNDTLVHENSLQNLIKFASSRIDAGVVGSKLLNTDGTLQTSCYNFPSLTNAVKEYWLNQRGLLDGFAPGGSTPVVVEGVVGASFLITPTALEKVGILDERYFAYYEDIDYCRKIWRAGLKVYYLPDSVITHIKGATFKKMSDSQNQWRKLIPGSIIYNGKVKHYLIFFVIWTGQKFKKYFSNKHR